MPSSRAPAVRAALVAALRARPALTELVNDGPVVTGDPGELVFVGYDGDPDGDMDAITVETAWAGTVGASRRNELITIVGCVFVPYGESDPDAATVATARAYQLLDEIDAAVMANKPLSQPPPVSPPAHITTHQLHTEPERGMAARLVWRLLIGSRI